MRGTVIGALLAALAAPVLGCDSCYGPSEGEVHMRNVKRMQPGVQNATSSPRGPLSWGQLNFLHTTDTHGWLEGHLKEQNYGADWGDFVSFTKDMKKKAKELDVDLLLVDTGDLHDGAGLSDVTSPNGLLSNPVFEHVDYDLLTIGNHELYLSDIAYLTADSFVEAYGDRYISSNVQIFNNQTQQYQDIANKYRYFTTPKGLRIMAYGLLYDFTGNSNASKVMPAKTVVQQAWFNSTLNFTQPIDLFLVIGHNPVQGSGSSISTIHSAIRAAHPTTPIQVFGGHTHIRDFAVYDATSTGMESGRYCETLGWLSMNNIPSKTYKGTHSPKGVPHPSQPAVSVTKTTTTATAAADVAEASFTQSSPVLYQRRYMDWNRLTFAYHSTGSQSKTFDTPKGEAVTKNITSLRTQLDLTKLYGCAPQTWCLSCVPYLANGSIFSLLATALSATVINETRADNARMILINTGSVRFDLVEGPFTLDDSYIVSPFTDTFQFIPDVPYQYASKVLGILNAGGYQKKRRSVSSIEGAMSPRDFGFRTLTGDDCVDAASVAHESMLAKRSADQFMTRGLQRRANATLTPGYTTTDAFGSDGDDTVHSEIPYYDSPNDLQANASFPTDGSMPQTVDLIFLDYIGDEYIIPALTKAGANYTIADIQQYLPPAFDTNAYLPAYAKQAWQANVPNCPVGAGVGFGTPGSS